MITIDRPTSSHPRLSRDVVYTTAAQVVRRRRRATVSAAWLVDAPALLVAATEGSA